MTAEEIKDKMEIGDYILAAKLLGISPENVRTRFVRKKEDVMNALRAIIVNRETFIQGYQNLLEVKTKKGKKTKMIPF